MMTLSSTTMLPSQIYVAQAALFPLQLRPQINCAGLCYFQLVHAVGPNYLVRVVALPHRLNDVHSRRVFTARLDAEQIAQALPYDRPLQCIPTCDLREMVELHVQQECGAIATLEDKPNAKLSPQKPVDELLAPLPVEIYVSNETMKDATEVVDAPPGKGADKHRRQMMLQYIWLQAAIMMVRRQMESAKWPLKGKLYAMYRKFHLYLCQIYEACHRSCQVFLWAHPTYIDDQQVGWHITIIIPTWLSRFPLFAQVFRILKRRVPGCR